MGCGVDIVPPGKQSCPYHFHHTQEEMFIMPEGSGTLRVTGERLPIKAGDVVLIPPQARVPAPHLNSSDEPLKYPSLSSKDYPEVCEYPDSGKLMAFSWKDGVNTVRRMRHKPTAVEYWEGEP